MKHKICRYIILSAIIAGFHLTGYKKQQFSAVDYVDPFICTPGDHGH